MNRTQTTFTIFIIFTLFSLTGCIIGEKNKVGSDNHTNSDNKLEVTASIPLSQSKQPEEKPKEATNTEITYWNTIKDSSNPEDFKAYLRDYPQGHFNSLAVNKIETLAKAQALAEAQTANKKPENVVDEPEEVYPEKPKSTKPKVRKAAYQPPVYWQSERPYQPPTTTYVQPPQPVYQPDHQVVRNPEPAIISSQPTLHRRNEGQAEEYKPAPQKSDERVYTSSANSRNQNDDGEKPKKKGFWKKAWPWMAAGAGIAIGVGVAKGRH